MKRYPNGELVTKERMEDEDWYYPLYQPFLEVCMGYSIQDYEGKETIELDVDELYQHVYSEFEKNEMEINPEQLLRWVTQHVTQMNGFNAWYEFSGEVKEYEVEDSGKALILEVNPAIEENAMFVRIQSWDESKEHEMFRKLEGEKITVKIFKS